MSSKKRIGLVGVGPWGRNILRDLVALGCEVHVVDRSGGSGDAARELGAATTVGSAADLPDVDGLVVATSSSSHAEVVRSVLGRGVPLFVEKPLTTCASDARDLVERAGDRIFVMDKWRYHPGVLALAEIARDGSLGSVVGLRSVRLSTGIPHPDTDPIWTLAPHDLSIALEVLGFLPAPVHAVADRDSNGIVGCIALLGTSPWLSIEVSGRYDRHHREIRLFCTEGVAILGDAYSDHVAIVRGRGIGQLQQQKVERREIGTEMPLLSELRAFVSYLGGGPPPKSCAQDGALVVETIARIRALSGIAADEQ